MSSKIYCDDGTETDALKARDHVYVQSNNERPASRESVNPTSNKLSSLRANSVHFAHDAMNLITNSKDEADASGKVITVTLDGNSSEFLKLADKNGDGNVSIQEIEELVKGNMQQLNICNHISKLTRVFFYS